MFKLGVLLKFQMLLWNSTLLLSILVDFHTFEQKYFKRNLKFETVTKQKLIDYSQNQTQAQFFECCNNAKLRPELTFLSAVKMQNSDLSLLFRML